MISVSTSLRHTIERLGSHSNGLRTVRQHLARLGKSLESQWSIGYFGKELLGVASRDGDLQAIQAAARILRVQDEPTRTGWSLAVANEAPSLSRYCLSYMNSVAAGIKRDRPDLSESSAIPILEAWRDTDASSPIELSESFASRLGAVLVAPYHDRPAADWRPNDDPRWPGVPGADGHPSALRSWLENPRPKVVHYFVTDVHEIETGLQVFSSSGPVARTAGNVTRLLPLSQSWCEGALNTEQLFLRSYEHRRYREQLLGEHLAELSKPPLDAFGTRGDGVEGWAASIEDVLASIRRANRLTEGELRSGVGLCRMLPDVHSIERARRNAEFSLHVTKLLRHRDCKEAEAHSFGTPLSTGESEAVLQYLHGLLASDGRLRTKRHHLDHAVRWRAEWELHLDPSHHSRFVELVSEAGRI